MAKPASVLRANLEAERQMAALAAQQAPALSDPESPLDPEPEDEPPAEAAVTYESAPPQDEGAPQDEVPQGGTDDGYEHRFRVLQGKYNAETRRLRDDNAALNARLANMEGLLTQLAARPAEPAPPASAPEPELPPVNPVSASELEEYGADMLDAASRFTLVKLMPLIKNLTGEVTELRGKVAKAAEQSATAANTIVQSARDTMLTILDEQVPDWRTVNVDDGFKSWLSQEDDMSGQTRHALLMRAYERNEGPRVLRFFNAYKAEQAAGNEPAAGRQTPANRAAPRVNPAALAAPGRGRNAGTPSTPLPQIEWTPDSIQAFYNDVRLGLFKSNPTERDRLERDIFAAQTEGRIQMR